MFAQFAAVVCRRDRNDIAARGRLDPCRDRVANGRVVRSVDDDLVNAIYLIV